MIEIISGRHGYGKSEQIFSRLYNSVMSENKAVLVVPEQFTVTAERKIASYDNFPMLDLDILSFSRLSDLLSEYSGEIDHHPFNKAKKKLLMKKIIDSVKPGYLYYKNIDFGNVSFVGDMLDACDILEKSNISLSEELSEQNNITLSKIHDINLTRKAFYNSIKSEFNSYPDKLSHLLDILKHSDWAENRDFFFDGFDTFTTQQVGIIKEIAKKAKNVCITLPYYPEDDSPAFSDINKFFKSFISNFDKSEINYSVCKKPIRFKDSDDLTYLESSLWNFSDSSFTKPFNSNDISIVSCNNKENECRAVASFIKKRVRENSKRFSDFSVVASNINDFSDILKIVFDEYEIPYYISKRVEIRSSFIVRAIYSLLNILIYNYRKEDVITLLKTGVFGFSKNQINLFENYIELWNLKGSIYLSDNEWDLDPRGYSGEIVGERENKLLAIINDIRFAVTNKAGSLLSAFKTGVLKDICTEIYNFISGIDKRMISESENGIDIYNAVSDSLDSIYEIYSGSEKITPKLFLELLDTVFSETDIGRIPKYSDRVLVSSAFGFRPGEISDISVLGMNEGVFPASVSSSSGLLSLIDYGVLASYDIELYDADKYKEERALYQIYNTLFFASEKIFITYLSSFGSDFSQRPSFAVERIKALFDNFEISDYNNFKYDFLIQNKGSAERECILNNDRDLEKILNEELIVNLKDFDYSDYKISDSTADLLYDDIFYITQSRTDDFSKCPFLFHSRHILRFKEPLAHGVNEIDIGNFVHKILELYISSLDFKNKDAIVIDRDSVHSAISDIKDKYLSYAFGSFTPDKRTERIFERIIDNISDLVIVLVEDLKKSGFIPILFEYDISEINGKDSPYEIELSNNKTGKVYGRIDRIDICENEGKYYIRIVDYKTGAKVLDLEKDIENGINLQMPLYMNSVIKSDVFRSKICPETDKLYNGGFQYISSKNKVHDRELNKYSDEEFINCNLTKDLKTEVVNKDITTGKNKKSYLILSNDDFSRISQSVDEAVVRIYDNIMSGVASADPILPGNYHNKNVCDYCIYKPMCKKTEFNYDEND